ncbi:metallophosphoesterase [Vibrio sp. HN007]|uniref:metallophosphoesterase family protein n=1 Tax=Vibrio iocasae TaxID=3098914 RepID=UPI0035D4EAE4
MKLLHVTDIHFNLEHMAWIHGQTGNADLVCITGDFIDSRYDCEVQIEEQVNQIKNWLSDFKIPVLVCSGNHDEIGDELDSSWLKGVAGVFPDGSITEIKGVTYGCAAYGTTDLSHFARCQVLLHHEPPSGLKVAKQGQKDFGSRYLTKAIKDGTLSLNWLLCGHVHSPLKNASKFRNCCISNPGSNLDGKIPNHHWINI